MSSSDPQKPRTGQGAGDPARTQQIPRAQGDKPASGGSGPGKPTSRPTSGGAAPASRGTTKPSGTEAAKKPEPAGTSSSAKKAAPGKGAAAKNPAAKSPGTSTRGTGSTGSASSAGTASASRTTAPTQRTAVPGSGASEAPAKGGESRTRGGSTPSSEPMTARDYARTTKESPDSTSVIPAVAPETAPEAAAASGSNRRAKLHLVHVDPWSVTRLAFVVSVALMIVSVVAVTIFWIVLDLSGVWDSLNGTITNVLSDGDGAFDLTDYLGLGRLVGLTLLLSAINVIVMTAIATIAAHLYNLAAQLLGGVGMTFADD